MAHTLAGLWQAKGHQMLIGSRDPDAAQARWEEAKDLNFATHAEALAFSDLVVLAAPWAATRDLIQGLGNPKGKIFVDITNSIAPDQSRLLVGGDTSAAEQIASWLPGCEVVKAFNTHFDQNLTQPDYSGERGQMFYCSDSAEAKAAVAGLIEDIGFDPLDCGPLSNARYIEAIAMLTVKLAFAEGFGTDFAFKVARPGRG